MRRFKTPGGGIKGISASSYAPKGVPMSEWDGIGVVSRAAAELRRIFGGVRHDAPDGWRTMLDFGVALPPATVARGMERFHRRLDLEGGRLLFGAWLSSGEWVPLSKAFRTSGESRAMAADTLLANLGKYGKGIASLPIPEAPTRRCPSKRRGNHGRRCRRIEDHDGKHRYGGPLDFELRVEGDGDD